MGQETAIDQAFAEMSAAPADDQARLRYFERVADSEVFLMLAQEADGQTINPELFELTDGRFVLVFDREERLAQFAGRVVPYAALSGRSLVQMLAGQGIGMGLNLEVAPSSNLIPAEAVDWLAELLLQAPDEVETGIQSLAPPSGLPESLLSALDTKLATAAGMAKCAYLAVVHYAGGGQGHLLAFIDAPDAARPALAKAANEALTFSGVEAGSMDVGFFDAEEPVAQNLMSVGLRFDLPELAEPEPHQPKAPGSDPDNPPKLR